ncbi:MAG TPA: MobF family relaxase [Acidimicrobiales bacterium]|nr:MobF family relaxase [Acidimicrobiales bacterium]
MNVGKLAPNAAEYFLGEVASSPIDYYTGAKEAHGYWCGSLAADLGLVGQVDPEDFRALLAGHDPRSGEALVAASGSGCRRPRVRAVDTEWLAPKLAAERLGVSVRQVHRLISAGQQGSSEIASLAAKATSESVRRPGWRVSATEVARYAATQAPKARRPGYDLAFRPPKSVSVAWALGDEQIREAIREAHREAVAAALVYLEDQAASARSGHNRARVATDGYVAAAFDHRTSRADDPLLHTHVVVANLTRLPDGTWRALDSRGIFRHARTAGFLYQAELRHLLSTRLGVAWEPVRNGWADIAGVPAALVAMFSKRRADIEAAVAESGASSARAYQAATLATRPRKEHDGGVMSLEDRWRAEAQGLDLKKGWLSACLGHRAPVAPSAEVMEALLDELGGPNGVTEFASTFDRRDVIRALCESAGEAVSAESLVIWADRFLASDRVVVLAPTSATANWRFSTPELVGLEARLLAAAEEAPSRPTPAADPAVLDRVLADHAHLSDEQRDMVVAMCTSARGLLGIGGRPGSGKTAATSACVEALVRSGVPVVGCSLSATAAAELDHATGLSGRTGRPASTIARLLMELDDPRDGGLAPGSVVIIDEASMAPTRLLARLLDHAERSGGALRLIGDPDQHGAVEAGGIFAAVVARAGEEVVMLKANHRQLDPKEREAISAYREGHVAEAVASYDEDGKLTRSATAAESYDAMAAAWFAARCEGRRDPMVAGTNAARSALNERARALLIGVGEVHGEVLVAAGREFQVGDEVVTRLNDRRLRGPGADFVKNGSVGRVVGVDQQGAELVVSFEAEGEIRLPATYVATGAVEHAYARTTYGLQGATLESAFYHPTDASSFEEGYVALTRARRSTELFLVEGEMEEDESHGTTAELTDTDTVVEALARRGAGRLAHAAGPSPGTGVQLAGVSLGELSARGEALDALLASEPPPVDLALAAAERRLQSLLRRQRRDGPLNPSKSGGRDTTSWIDAAIQLTEEEVASLRTLRREREVWLVNYTPELEDRKAVRHAAAARRVQLVHMLRAKPPAAVLERLGPRPSRPAAARRWDAAAAGVITGLDATNRTLVETHDPLRRQRATAPPAGYEFDVR